MEALAARDGRALGRTLKLHLANKLANVKEWLAQQHAVTATPIPVGSRPSRRRNGEAATGVAEKA
jgi:hypothetical protein